MPSDYRNDTPMKERLEQIFNEKSLRRKDTGTFLSHTHSDEGGRFAKPQNVVGSAPSVEYPQQPEGSFPNQAAVVGVEPPYDGDISAPIVGESFEVAASIDRLERAQQASAITSTDPIARRGAGAVPSNVTASNAPANPLPTNKLRPQR